MFERLKLLGLVALGFAAGYVVGVLHLGAQLEGEHARALAETEERAAALAAELAALHAERAALPAASAGESGTDPHDIAAPAIEAPSVVASTESAPPTLPGVTPGSFAVLMKQMEEANTRWFEEFRAQPVDPVWAAQAEHDIRSGLRNAPQWRDAQVESLECRSTACVLVLVNRLPERRPGDPPPPWFEHPWPGYDFTSPPPEPVAGQPGTVRMQIFITRPAPPAGQPRG